MEKFKNNEINDLNAEVNSLRTKSNILFTDIMSLERAKKIMENNDTPSGELGNLISKFYNDNDAIISEVKQKKQKIKEIQDKCSHNWMNYGHDSHHDYYICTICGKEDRV